MCRHTCLLVFMFACTYKLFQVTYLLIFANDTGRFDFNFSACQLQEKNSAFQNNPTLISLFMSLFFGCEKKHTIEYHYNFVFNFRFV